MKLPLYIQWQLRYDKHGVFDAEHRLICLLPDTDRKFGLALIRKMNRHWRFRLFGHQPYAVNAREDWLSAKNPCGNRTICLFNRGILGVCLCKEKFEKAK